MSKVEAFVEDAIVHECVYFEFIEITRLTDYTELRVYFCVNKGDQLH